MQILGAEKALFKAMRTKHNTPKYGLIYHASLVGAAAASVKGKISRSLAAKCALCIRYDALGESTDGAFGVANKAYIEAKLKQFEGTAAKAPAAAKPVGKYSAPSQAAREYNPAADFPAVAYVTARFNTTWYSASKRRGESLRTGSGEPQAKKKVTKLDE